MTDNKPGPTGDYPMGKLNDDDEGGLVVAISRQDYPKGKVVRIDFGPKPVAWVCLPPDAAIEFAETIIKYARALI